MSSPAESRRPRRALRPPASPAEPASREAEALAFRVAEAPLTPSARRMAILELGHFRRAAPASAEYVVLRNHLEWLLELPWEAPAPGSTPSLARVTESLERSHVGLVDVKQRIAEFLAIRTLGGGARGTVLCFLGPPGTGKSSMGRAVASALGRPFLSIPLGAKTEEKEIVGTPHRVPGAMPGAILAGVHRAGAKNPVVLLDELDKLRLGAEGSSAGALLNILDPEQNGEFLDNYLGVPFDLSPCLFLATANDAEAIPGALLDRMETIEFHGYSEAEKLEIARRHLLPRARAQAGVDRRQFRISPAALRTLIRGWTEEAGVRDLQRRLVALARKAALGVVCEGRGLHVKQAGLVELLGPRVADEDVRRRRPAVGVATGLAWTAVGGALLPIESIVVPGGGRMILTGRIGEVLRESVQTALSYVRTRFDSLGVRADVLDSLDLHLHFPAGATPKDGPSAGIAIATAVVSLLTRRPARHDVAMTGEMSLLGRVLPVGGIREKLLAAVRTGIPEVIVPLRNAEEVMRLSTDVRRQLTIHFVDDVVDAFELALVGGVRSLRAIPTGEGTRGRAPRRARRRRLGRGR
ncbi:MAG: S16 family serine protease [Planctomycetota bacterium]